MAFTSSIVRMAMAGECSSTGFDSVEEPVGAGRTESATYSLTSRTRWHAPLITVETAPRALDAAWKGCRQANRTDDALLYTTQDCTKNEKESEKQAQ